MDWKGVYQTHSVLEIEVESSIGVMAKGDLSFISVLKISLSSICDLQNFFYREFIHMVTSVIRKFIHGDNTRSI